MLRKTFAYRKIVILLFFTLMASGCLKRDIIAADPLTKNILFAIDNAVAADDIITALAQINLTTLQGSYPLRAALILKKPSYLRLELLPVVGTPDLFLTATPAEMKILLPSKGEFYRGKPTGDNLAQFLPWKFGIDEMVPVLLGSYPPLSGEGASYERITEKDTQRIEMRAQSGKSQTLWVDKNKRLVKIVCRNESGFVLYTVLYEDYRAGLPLAGKITINIVDGTTSLTIMYSDPQIEKSKDISVFDLPLPAGYKEIKMD